MKSLKTFFAVLALSLFSLTAYASTVDDLVAISNDWAFIADNITNDGTTKLVANTLYAGNQIFAPTNNTVATNKGTSTFSGGQHLNSLRLKNAQDRLAFKVAGACTVTFYTYNDTQNARGIYVSTTDNVITDDAALAKQPASTPVWAVELPAAGTYYLTSYNNDFYFAGFEVVFDKTGQPTISTHPVSASYELNATAAALTVEATAVNEGALSYQWYKNSLENFVSAEAIEGATEASYIPSTTVAGTSYYFCKVTEAGNEKVATSKICAIEVLEPGFIVTFSLGESGAEGIVPAAGRCVSLTIPTNRTLYKAGNTLTGWSDGADTYAIGAEYIPTADATLTPVFTENAFDVLTATSDITVLWDFQTKNGAPVVAWEGATGTGFLVAQATLGNNQVDVKLAVDATSGKFNNTSSTDWCQINTGTKLEFPSKKDAIVEVYTYADPATSTLDGNKKTGDWSEKKATFNTSNESGTSVFEVKDGQYYRYLKVTYPASSATALEQTDANAKATKILRNGILLIEKNGKFYNALGVEVK